jgi:FdrA protein
VSILLNHLQRGYYADSVTLMRVSRELSARDGVETASLMIGTPSNRALLAGAGLLNKEGRSANPNDLVIAVRAKTQAAGKRALEEAVFKLENRADAPSPGYPRARRFDAALSTLPMANLALISTPGDYATAEAERALESGLHVMVFSDNVPVADEIRLKRLAAAKGLLMMGPDCGTAIVGGVPLAFANSLPRGDIGLISASGTGLQEVSSLLARRGLGVSQAIGVGGRDLSDAVGGIMTLAALEALEADPATRCIVVISKPPSPKVARRILGRIAKSAKPFVVCLLGASAARMPHNATLAPTLLAAAQAAADERINIPPPDGAMQQRQGRIEGLFCGGTLCAEAQLVLMQQGLPVSSNAPVPGASASGARSRGHRLLDLGDDEYTRGRPHPMIDPSLRNELVKAAAADRGVAVLLLDVVIGYGAHENPARTVLEALGPSRRNLPVVVASVTGTETDPQGYSAQVQQLRSAGVVVAASNAEAALAAATVVGGEKAIKSRQART